MEVHIKEFGTRQSRSIVFLHGGGLGGWMWDRQVRDFSDFHCLIPDLPGHGESCGIHPFTIENSAMLIAELIRRKAHGAKAHVVGHSLGAQVVVQLLSSCSEVVDHAVINSALICPSTGVNTFSWPVVKLTEMLGRFRWFAKLQANALGIPRYYFNSYYNNLVSMGLNSWKQVLREGSGFPLPVGLKNCTVPTLIIAGQREVEIMHKSAKQLLDAIPTSQGFYVSGVGHCFNFDNPELFEQTLRAWFTDKPLLQASLRSLR